MEYLRNTSILRGGPPVKVEVHDKPDPAEQARRIFGGKR